MAVNRVDFSGETLIDLTGDTVTPESLLQGYSAHDKSGGVISGDAVIPTKLSELENDAGYAKAESPTFTGVPKAPTPVSDTNDEQIATTAYVKTLISNLINGAPETLDTLKEIADALGENDEAIQVLNSAIGNKLNKTGDAKDTTVTFTQAEARTNVESGETAETLFGKIKKWFSDLKTVAFTGSYNDLSDQPDIPAGTAVKGDAETEYRTGDVNITPDNIGVRTNSQNDSRYVLKSGDTVKIVADNSEDVYKLGIQNGLLYIEEVEGV